MYQRIENIQIVQMIQKKTIFFQFGPFYNNVPWRDQIKRELSDSFLLHMRLPKPMSLSSNLGGGGLTSWLATVVQISKEAGMSA